MRKLTWFSLGFVGACLPCAYFPLGLRCLALSGAFFGLMALARRVSRRIPRVLRLSVVFLGFSVGFFWFWVYDMAYLLPARAVDGETQTITVTVTGQPREDKAGVSVDGKMPLSGRQYQIWLYLQKGDTFPSPGDQVTVSAQLRFTGQGGGREPTYHRGGGVFLLAYAREESTQTAGTPSWLARLRMAVGGWMDDLFPEDTRGFARALLLGDTSELSYPMRNELSLAGLSHVLAVSGLHISILFSIVYVLSFGRQKLLLALAWPLVWLLAAMVGFSPSVTRAAVMVSLGLVARMLGREYDGRVALGAAVVVLLAVNPYTAASVSFQMSVGAVAGILLFAMPLKRWLNRRKLARFRLFRRMMDSVAVTLSVTVVTMPLSVGAFGVVSLVAPLTNVLALPAVTAAFCVEIAACLFGAVWNPLGRLLATVASWLLRYVKAVSGFLGNLPGGAIFPQESPYLAAFLVLAVVSLLAFYLGRYRAKRTLAAVLGVAFVVCGLLGIVEPRLDRFRVTVLDVGQGQCVLLQSGGRTYVVDCGGTGDDAAGEKAARHLITQGIYRVDGLILTHFDDDHISGVRQLLRRISVDTVYAMESQDCVCQTLAEEIGDDFVLVTEDMSLDWDGAELRIFAPPELTEKGQRGLSVLFTVGEYDTLITGDLSTRQERWLLTEKNLPDLELLVAGHHGAATSTGMTLLRQTRPEVLAISVGRNTYGHPAQSVLERAALLGCRVLRTDRDGTLIFRG